jgi:hypothetical protein
MQRQSARRKLVVAAYALLAAFCVSSIVYARSEPLFYSWTIYATMAVAFFLFGGTGRYGLIKPFPNKPPRPEPVMVEMVRLQLEPLAAGTADESRWKNDERELSRRDLAHYKAYQVTAVILVVLLGVSAFGLRAVEGLQHLEWLTVSLALNLMFAIALAGCVLALTLPAAIILWTEPDIEL